MTDHDLRAEIERLRREKRNLLAALTAVIEEIDHRPASPVADYARRVIAKHEEKTR